MAYKFVMLCTPLSKDCQSVKKDPVLRSQIKMVELLSKEGKALYKDYGLRVGELLSPSRAIIDFKTAKEEGLLDG
jgi:hypothetical protein